MWKLCFYILFSLILYVILEIKLATGSTGLIKNFQEVRKYTWKGARSEQVTNEFLLMSILYCKSHELEETC